MSEGALSLTGALLSLVGSLFYLTAAVGLLRLPDFYSRIHGGGITDTLGAGLVLLGLMLQATDWLVVFKLSMILFFLLITSPTSAHALSKAAHAHGIEPLLAGEEELFP